MSQPQPRLQPQRQLRRGTTHLELIVASVLLTATLVGITAYRQRTLISNQRMQRASLAQSRTLNMRREIDTWPIDEITVANIENANADKDADDAYLLPEARWIVEVQEIETPISGKQVVLAIQWQEGANAAISPGLTFWVRHR